MGEPKNGMSCSTGCWALAAGIGLVTFVILMIMSGFSFFAALFLGLLVFVLTGLLFNWLFCASDTTGAASTTATTSSSTAAAATGAAAAATAATAGAATSGAVKSDTTLAGEDELASRKGDWKYEGDADGGAAASTGTADTTSAEAAAPAAAEASAASVSTSTSASTTATPVKSNTTLAGEEELASRKGEWKYEAPAAEKAPAKKAAAKKAPAKKAAAKTTAEKKPAAKKTTAAKAPAKKAPAKKAAAAPAPAAEAAPAAAAGAGTKPATLNKPRAGGADDLKMIKGVGPKLEEMLHTLGFYHFDQVAAWKDAEVAWVDQNLKGFKGRATRDSWVEQAKLLAAGEETEFSKRASKDGMYK